MDDYVRLTLCHLIAQYGHALCEDPRRCEGVLRDACSAYRREIFVLMSALREGVTTELLGTPPSVPCSVVLPRLSQRLQDNYAFTEDAARWAVATWALALGTLSLADLDAWQTAPQASRGVTRADTPPTSVLAPILVNSIGMEFVLIPPGEFLMGSNDGRDNEKPAHNVRISRPFYLGKCEVTQSQWQEMMGNNPSRFKGDRTLPVESVSWKEVQEFIHRLNAKEVSTLYHLPTEAEWEYTARAGSTTAYNFGDDEGRLGEYAWYSANDRSRPHPVGQKQPNAWGLYDMHGNVWEWVQDWYGAYSRSTAVDPAGPSSGSLRVLRGGGWGNSASYCRLVRRSCDAPDKRDKALGFRLLRTAE